MDPLEKKDQFEEKKKEVHRQPLKLYTERSYVDSPNKNVRDVRPQLELVKVDHHFAPCLNQPTEDLQIVYKIKNFGTLPNARVVLIIKDRTGGVVYFHQLDANQKADTTDQGRTLTWKGNVIKKAGNWEVGDLVNPLLSPYQVKLQSDNPTLMTEVKETHVLYRRINLESLSWLDAYKAFTTLADGTYPATLGNNIKKLWIQYRLNELGYPAGALIAPLNLNAIMRALFRYTQSHIGLNFPKIYDYQTLQAGAPGQGLWGWKAKWEALYGTLDELVQGPVKVPGIALMRALSSGDQIRNDLFSQSTKLHDKSAHSRAILDHDILYLNEENTEADAHVKYDKEFLNGFCWPMQAKVQLVSRTDADAKANGVVSPEAVGPVKIEWLLFDPPENYDFVPGPVTSDVPVKFKSKTRNYLNQLQISRAGSFGDTLHALDNCPVDLGGIRPVAATNVTGNFFKLHRVCQSVSPDGNRFITTAEKTAPAPHLGTSAVFFQGSYIAGDNYVVQARIVWDQVPNGDALKADHQSLPGLSNSFPDQKKCLNLKESGDPMVAQSAQITIWRRHHVVQEITWMENNYPPIKWGPVVKNFEAAHIILVPPSVPAVHIENLFGTPVKNDLATVLKDGFVNYRSAGKKPTTPCYVAFENAPNAEFHREGLYPLPLPDFNTVSPVNKEKTPIQRFDSYSLFLDGYRNEWPKYAALRPFFQALREEMDKLGRGRGVIILRAALFPLPQRGNLPNDVRLAVQKQKIPYKYPYRALSAGGDHGIVLLDEDAINKFDETFHVSHEIGHCLFLTHKTEIPGDHDDDNNCLLIYNNQNKGEFIGWGSNPNTLPTNFEMSVMLSDSKGMKSFGNIGGNFVKQDNTTFRFSGSIQQCEKALKSFKFTPQKNLDPNFEQIITLFPGKVAPGLSVELPYAAKTKISDGTVKPFENLRAVPPDPTATKPFFCGKCLLKLRGWKVRTDNTVLVGANNVIEKSEPIPVNPRMECTQVKMQNGYILLSSDTLHELKPFRFVHPHTLYWESSDGKLASLSNVLIREYVSFDKPTQSPPFNVNADEDQEFYQVGTRGNLGAGTDDHMIRLPAFVCDGTTGTHLGKQKYQYSLDGVTYMDIEGAEFLIEKTVYMGKHGLTLKFKKTNWLPYNKTPYNFEMHYLVGPLLNLPNIKVSNVTPLEKQPSVGAVYLQWGAQKITTQGGTNTVVTEKQLASLGFLAPKPWPT